MGGGSSEMWYVMWWDCPSCRGRSVALCTPADCCVFSQSTGARCCESMHIARTRALLGSAHSTVYEPGSIGGEQYQKRPSRGAVSSRKKIYVRRRRGIILHYTLFLVIFDDRGDGRQHAFRSCRWPHRAGCTTHMHRAAVCRRARALAGLRAAASASGAGCGRARWARRVVQHGEASVAASAKPP